MQPDAGWTIRSWQLLLDAHPLFFLPLFYLFVFCLLVCLFLLEDLQLIPQSHYAWTWPKTHFPSSLQLQWSGDTVLSNEL